MQPRAQLIWGISQKSFVTDSIKYSHIQHIVYDKVGRLFRLTNIFHDTISIGVKIKAIFQFDMFVSVNLKPNSYFYWLGLTVRQCNQCYELLTILGNAKYFFFK